MAAMTSFESQRWINYQLLLARMFLPIFTFKGNTHLTSLSGHFFFFLLTTTAPHVGRRCKS